MGPRSKTLLAVLVLTACQPPAFASDDPEDRVRNEVRAAAEALLAAKNLPDGEAAVAFYQDGPQFTYLGCTEFIVGGEAFNRLLAPAYDRRAPGAFRMQVTDIKVTGPEAAVVQLVGSTDTQPHLFATQLWVRDDGWKVALEHASWPGCRVPPGAHPFTTPSEQGQAAPGG